MRTLKRTMCLVLSMVMLLGVCTVFVSAVDTNGNLGIYPDRESIEYKEAVDVLTGIGVLQGDSRGFRPKDNVTRAEAAKILAYLLIGDAGSADALHATAKTFTDVETTHWAAGYIAYCAEQKIVVGRGDGTYDPSGNVTGLEFAKMMLRAIGYGVNKEYEGATWAINVAKDGVQYGIYNGYLAGASETPATREQCALYAFNTLLLRKVTYSELFGGYIENVRNQGNQAQSNKYFTIAQDYGLKTTMLVDAETAARFDYGQTYIDENSIESDMFYRPIGHYWYQRQAKNAVSDYYGGDDYLLASFNKPVSGTDLYNVLKDYVGDIYTTVASRRIPVVMYENGARYQAGGMVYTDQGLTPDTVGAAEFTSIKVGSQEQIARNNDKTLAHTGYGVETNVYAISNQNGDVEEIRITLVHTYLGQVSRTSRSDGYITIKAPSSYNTYVNDDFLRPDNNRLYDLNFSQNDYVLYNYSFRTTDSLGGTTGIQPETVRNAEILSNRFTYYTNTINKNTSGNIGVAGVYYFPAKDDGMPKNNQTPAHEINRSFVNTNAYTIFTDGKGNIIGTNEQTVYKDFVYVSEFGYRFDTAENDIRERLKLTAKVYDSTSTGKDDYRVVFVDTGEKTKTKLSVDNWFDVWAEKAMNSGEADYVSYLNGQKSYDSGVFNTYVDADGKAYVNYEKSAKGLYYMSGSRDSATLINVEDYAASLASSSVHAVGENFANAAAAYAKMANLRRLEKDTDMRTTATDTAKKNVNWVPSNNMNLVGGNKTIYFYVKEDGALSSIQIGLSNSVTANKFGSVSWYGEEDNSQTTAEILAHAVVLIEGTTTGPNFDVTEQNKVPVYLYVDSKDTVGDIKGNYSKSYDGTDWVINYTLIKVSSDNLYSEVTIPVHYDNEDDANEAAERASKLISKWVVVNDKKGEGLEAFIDGAKVKDWYEDEHTDLDERESINDDLIYVKTNKVTNMRESDTGLTLYYNAKILNSRYLVVDAVRVVEIRDDAVIYDVRNRDTGKIMTFDELIDARDDVYLAIAYKNGIASAVYIVDAPEVTP